MTEAAALFHSLPLYPAAYAASLGSTVVIVPHPDDEALGCGGLLALLRQAGQEVRVVLVSDGTMSHPNSRKFPPAARQALRQAELEASLRCLGANAAQVLYLKLPDGAVPGTGPETEVPAQAIRRFLAAHSPQTILVPWRRDPHPDHRATHALLQLALAGFSSPPRVIEYLVWAWERAAPADLPLPGEATGWRLDIQSVLAQKQAALAAHASQLPGSPINDDPTGFTLAESMLAHFAQPFETYLEVPLPTGNQEQHG
jgi:LmbE family N-acetylglucosaminyl deacetylase